MTPGADVTTGAADTALTAHPDDGPDLGLDLGIRTGFGVDWLRIGAMKIFTDGSLVGLTAAIPLPPTTVTGSVNAEKAAPNHSAR